ncbi:MAG: dTDP-4-dehydrorhamnose reductase [Gaiellaceae bacterium]|jgi:dTDP-4-dehydrorhamnose reductase|nr:dTDP-4-dehydrorhamnose reductase [Gaiellaceae bacterium]
MLILVTGGTGYLGRELVALAPEAVAAGFSQSAALQFDIRDPDAVEKAIRDMSPEAIIHTAYRQDDPDAWAINVDGSGNVARAAAANGARLIHLSTDVIFDGTSRTAYTEMDTPHPVTAYGRTKAAAEEQVRAADPAALLVRTSLIYGGATLSKHEELALAAADGLSDTAFFTDELRSPIQVGDLAAALLELVATDLAGPLHVAGADTVSRHAFAALVVARHGRDPARLRATTTTELGLVRPLDCGLDSARARHLLRTGLRGVHTVLG